MTRESINKRAQEQKIRGKGWPKHQILGSGHRAAGGFGVGGGQGEAPRNAASSYHRGGNGGGTDLGGRGFLVSQGVTYFVKGGHT